MAQFYPGDKVRFLDEDGEGVVVAATERGVMVRTADGFEIPYPATQLVKFERSTEKVHKVFNSESTIEEVLDEHGLFMAYVKKATDSCPGFFVNRTMHDLYFSLCEKVDGEWKGRMHGVLPSGKFTEVVSRYVSQVASWNDLSFRVLYIGEGKSLPEPKTFVHQVPAKRFLNSLAKAPLINKDAYLFQLDGDEWKSQQKEWKNKLKSVFNEKDSDVTKAPDETKEFVPDVVDLHIEVIPNAPSNLGVKSILKFQIGYAEKMLDKAIAAGMPKITFIHGAGDGVLKREVQQMAKQNPHVTSYGKGDPAKYGGGATFLKIE